MPKVYGRDLDLNLLRVFAVVAETGSVTEAAKSLYLTQPAVSAALRRLTDAAGAPLFVRQGRGLALSTRGTRLRAAVDTHLQQLVDAALEPQSFDPRTSTRTFRLGLSDSSELWLLPRLLKRLAGAAPHVRLIVVPVQFRNVGALLASGLELALTVADELPANIRRSPVLHDSFVVLYDPRFAKFKKLDAERYFAHEHVIVSYNGDLRGVVEDLFHKQRRVRCSVSSFAHVGALIDGTAVLATVPRVVADALRASRPHLRTKPVPFEVPSVPAELLWPLAVDDDALGVFMREQLSALIRDVRP